MGGLFSRYEIDPNDQLIVNLSNIKPFDIEQLIEYYNDNYSTSTLDFQQFDELFSPYLNDIEDYFQQLKGATGQVEWYQTLALVILGCKAPSKWKIQFLFSLFDFDNSGDIDIDQLTMTVGVCSKALSKLGKVAPPKESQIFRISLSVFDEMDADKSLSLDQDEVISWCEVNIEIQEIMATLSQDQSIELAKLRYQDQLAVYQQLFENNLKPGPGQKLAHKDSLLKGLKEISSDQDVTDQQFLLLARIMAGDQLYIKQQDFLETMKNWASFNVADYSRTKTVDKKEMRVMMSFKRGTEVPIDWVEETMRIIDVESKGYVTRKDWLQFLSVESTGDDSSISIQMKRSFDMIDQDGSGTITLTEMENIILEFFRESIAVVESSRSDVQELIKGIAHDIVRLAGHKDLNWIEFKKHFPNIEEKLETTRNLIQKYF